MPYQPTNWVEGVTALGPANMNKIEQGILSCIPLGDNNAEIAMAKSLIVGVDTRSIVATAWDSDDRATTLEIRDGAVVLATINRTYNLDGRLVSAVAVVGSGEDTVTVTYTITWNGDRLVSLEKGVS